MVGLFFGSALLAFTILVSEVAFTIRLRREWNAQAQWERDEEERIRGIRLEVGSLGGSIGLSEMVERTMRDRGLSRADNRASYVSTNGRTVTSDDIAAYRAGYGDYQRDSRAQRTVSEVSPMDSGMDEPEDWTDDIGTGVRSWDEPVERYEVRRDNAGWGDESWGGAHIGADGRRGVGYAM